MTNNNNRLTSEKIVEQRMKILIDIPVSVYEDFTKTHGIGYVTKDTIRIMENALLNGIKLSEEEDKK